MLRSVLFCLGSKGASRHRAAPGNQFTSVAAKAAPSSRQSWCLASEFIICFAPCSGLALFCCIRQACFFLWCATCQSQLQSLRVQVLVHFCSSHLAHRGLTPHSSRQPTAASFCLLPIVPWRRGLRLNSNVRPRRQTLLKNFPIWPRSMALSANSVVALGVNYKIPSESACCSSLFSIRSM